VTTPCRQYGISRETGNKWLNRYRQFGHDGLEEKRRRLSSSQQANQEAMPVRVPAHYPAQRCVRRVAAHGLASLHDTPVAVTKALIGYCVAFEPLATGRYPIWLGKLDIVET
jgi:transposase-like protein